MRTTTTLLLLTPFVLGDGVLALRLKDALVRAKEAERALVRKDVDSTVALLEIDPAFVNYLSNNAVEDVAKIITERRGTVDAIVVRNTEGKSVSTSGTLDESPSSYTATKVVRNFGRAVGSVVASKKLH